MLLQRGFEESMTTRRAEGRSGADLAAFRERRNAVRSAERERFDRHGGLAAARGHQAASIAEEKVFDVVSAVIGIDDGTLRIISHAAGAEKVHGELLFLRREAPLFFCSGGFKDFMSAGEHPIPKLYIVWVILVGQAKCGQAPRVLQIGIE